MSTFFNMFTNRKELRALSAIALAVAGTLFVTISTASAQSTDKCLFGSAEQRAQGVQDVALFTAYEAAETKLWKALARAGHAPAGYISPNVSPDIRQGPTITDFLDAVVILRADLYYAHDQSAAARQACRDGDCSTYVLPSSHASAAAELVAFNAAWNALPMFQGAPGTNMRGIPGLRERKMDNMDYMKLQESIARNCIATEGDEGDRTRSNTTSAAQADAREIPSAQAQIDSAALANFQREVERVNQIVLTANQNDNSMAQLNQLVAQLNQHMGDLKKSTSASDSSAPVSMGGMGSTMSSMSQLCKLKRSIRRGSVGTDVSALQTFLAKMPSVYPEGQVTGFFGPLTETAVMRWQSMQGIVSNGNAGSTGYGAVGPRTLKMLRTGCDQ